jgi:Tol biopolymer transport system component
MKHGRTLQVLGFALALASTSRAQETRRISVSSSGHQGDAGSTFPSISADGLSVAFESTASNLVGGDTNGHGDVFFHNRLNGQTEIDSVGAGSVLGNSDSIRPSLSADGRYLVFDSGANNLVPGDTNGQSDVFLRDRVLGTTQRLSISSGGVPGDDDSYVASISADGRYVAFYSYASNLVSGDTNGVPDVFVRDRLSAVTERVSLSSSGVQGNGTSREPSISGDGRFVAFQSDATNLISSDTNGFTDIFVRDRLNGTTVRASVNNAGWYANGNCTYPAISADGRFVTFASVATNLIGPLAFDTNGVEDVFCRDLVNGGTSRLSVSASEEGNGLSSSPSISGDGRFVAFQSRASNLVSGDTNGDYDIFVRDRSANTIERVSRASNGTQGNEASVAPTISADGRLVAFMSTADNLVTGDSNDEWDVFLHDRNASGFTSVCHPGVDGVTACPCANQPSASGRGCNNSSNTGGAFLTAAGVAYLSTDSLVFTSFAERPAALSVLMQGNALVASGAVYGQGVRCVGGSLKRLFTKNASSGSISVPDFGAGDPSVSSRSAAKGDTIQPGQSRWYLVYYRDPTVLGGCPASSTLNATQTGHVKWQP